MAESSLSAHVSSVKAECIIAGMIKRGILEVDEQGRIWRVMVRSKTDTLYRCQRRRAELLHGTGYWRINVQVDRIQYSAASHRIVWAHLHGEIDAALVVNHINGVKSDNRPANLELITPSENVRHAIDTGLLKPKRGEKHNCAKLTDVDVMNIRSRLAAGESGESIARDYKIGQSSISRIKIGKSWSHLKSCGTPES